MTPTFKERRSWRRVRVSLVREHSDRPYAVRHAGDVVGLLRAFLRDDPREQFVAVYLDTRHRPIAVHDAHVGTCDSSPVHPREIFGPAVALSATAIVVAHNHPSGDPTPSTQDRAVTERLRAAGELLGIPVLDHLVLGDARFFSFAEEAFRPLAGDDV
ncbi:MAG: DNA repair protein RadC [Planctomycetes bacterium]|nr:DNA repair protein RadC [Planctomycetota bacterium]